MRRFVSREQRLTALAVAVILSLMLVFETGKALVLLVCIAITGMILKIDENPPGWLLRSPLGRWLRRSH